MKEIEKYDMEFAMKVLCKALKEDPAYYYGWKANIAMSFYDEFRRSKSDVIGTAAVDEKAFGEMANRAVDNFLILLLFVKGDS